MGLATDAVAAGNYVLAVAGGTGGSGAPVPGPVTSSPLASPGPMATDGSGNTWIFVANGCRVVKVTSGGTLSVVAGTGTCGNTPIAGPATSSPLSASVKSLAVDASGNLFVGDNGAYRIYKVTPAGVLSVFAGNGTSVAPGNGVSATSSSVGADSMAIDSGGNLYAGWVARAYILRITAAGQLTRFMGTGTAGSPAVGVIGALTPTNKPVSLAADSGGNLYIGDSGANRIYRVVLGTLLVTSFAGTGGTGTPVPGSTSSPVPQPVSMSFDPAGTLFVAEAASREILSFTATGGGAPSLVAGTGGAGTPVAGAATSSPLGNNLALVATATETLLVADADSNLLLKVTTPTVPDAPTGLSSVPGNGSATLSFTPGASGGSAITGYQYTTNGGLTWPALTVTGGATKTGTVTGLTNGVQYNIQVRAVNAVGTSPASTTTNVTPATAPGVPTLVTAVGGDAQLQMTYLGPLDNGGSAVTGYQYTLDNGTTWTTLPANNIITGLNNGTAYTVKLRAVNAAGAGVASAGSTATPRGAPNAPTDLAAGAGNRQATVVFTTPSDGGYAIAGYQVSTDDGTTWANLAVTTSGTTNTGTVTGLDNGTTYRIRVRAVNLGGNGTPSASVTVTPPVVPADAPTGLVATASSGQVALAFQDPANTGGPITGYEVSTDNGTTWSALTVATGLLSKTATVTGLTNGTAYAFKVRVVNAAGPGAASTAATATPRGVPYAPAGLSVAPGDRQATVTFTTPADGGYGLLGYQVSTDDGATWNVLTVTTAGTTNTGVAGGLTNGVTYKIRVRAINLAGNGLASDAVTTTLTALPPDAPTGLVATAGDASVLLAFQDPANNGGSPVTGYEASSDDGATWAPVTVTTGLLAKTATVTGLTNGTTYAFRVRAVNAVGKGAASANASATPRGAPYAPGNLTAVGGDRQATLTFTTPGDGGNAILGYQASTDNGTTWVNLAVTTSGSTNTGTVAGLNNATTYAMRVRAVSLAGAGAPSATATVSLAALAPDAPTGLLAVGGNGNAALSFADPVSTGGAPITGYEVTTDAGASWSPLTAGGTLVRTADVTGLTNGVNYTFQVRARNAAGPGAASNASSATPRGTAYAPTGLTVTSGPGQAVLTFTTPADGGYPILGYQVSTDDGATWNTLTVTTTGNANNGTVTGLTNGTPYAIRVRATTLAGAGAASGSVTVTPATVPGAPTGVTAVAGNTQATISWTPPANDGGTAVTGYEVSTDNGATWAPMPTGNIVTGLTNGGTYQVRVRAVNAVGAGAASSPVGVTPIPNTPDAPTSLTAVRGDRRITLSFTAPAMTGTSPISSYEVSTDDGATWSALAADRVVTGLTNGTTYAVRVRAVNASGPGVASASVSATPATVPGVPRDFAVVLGDTTAVLSWTPPLSDGGDPVTSYEVSTDDGTTWSAVPADRTVRGLTNGSDYAFRLRARNSVGAGDPTAAVGGTPATVPGAPADLTATPGDQQAVVSFTPPASTGGAPITGYEVSTDDGATFSALRADRVVTGLTNGVTYTLRVRALNRVGAGPASPAAQVTPDDGLPGAPTGLSVTRGDASATLSFTAPARQGSSPVTGYQVSTDGGVTWSTLATNRVVTGLTNGTGYDIQVRAVNGAGAGPATASVRVTPATVPGAPTGLSATRGDRSATLTFTGPASDGGSAVTSYEVSTDDGATWGALAADRVVTGLTNGVAYPIRVRARNDVGAGAPSASATVTPATVAGAPTGLTAQRGNGTATLTFTAPGDTGGDPVTGYQVSTDDGVTWTALAANRVVTGLTNGVTYTVRVRAVNSSGPGAASTAALVTPATTPGAPTGLNASAGDASAVLMFTDPASDGGDAIVRYEVSTDGGASYAPLADDRTVTGLSNGVTYTVRVRAVNSVGAGAPSATAQVTPVSGLPGAPTGLTATRGDRSVTLAFTAPGSSSPITGYDYSLDGGATWTALAANRVVGGLTNGTAYTFWVRARNSAGPGPASAGATATPAAAPGVPVDLAASPGDRSAALSFGAPASDGGDPIVRYEVSTDNGASYSELGADRVVTGLTNGVSYAVRVRAVNSVGTGPATAAVTVTPAPGTPGAPTGLVATRGDSSATLSFTPPATGPVTSYEVSIDDGAGWAALPASRVVSGLTNGVAYTIRVRARNAAGAGPASDSVTVVPAAVPGAPGPLTATAGDSTATLSFAPPADNGGNTLTGYEVSTDDGATWSALSVSGTTTLTGTVTGLVNGVAYALRVRAVNDAGPGTPTAGVTVTPAGVPGPPTALNADAGDASATLMFAAPASDGGSPITAFEVSVDDGASYAALRADRVVTGLTNGVTYTVRVRAVNGVGAGAASDSATVTPAAGLPGAPTGLTATRGDASAVLTFTPPASASPITGYEYSPDDGWNWAPLAADGRVTGLVNGVTYAMRVRAVNGRGSGPASASATVTPAGVPGSPTGLAATAGDSSAALTFNAPASSGGSPVTGYEVSLDDGVTFATLAADRVVTGLTNGVTYTLRVRARNDVGTGPQSTAVTVTPAAVPGAVADLRAEPGDASAVLSFTAPGTGGAAITGYEVSTDNGATFSPLRADRVVTGLTNGVTYAVRVRALNSAGAGPASAAVGVTPAAVPGRPTDVFVSLGDRSLAISFTAPAAGGSAVTGYQVSLDDGVTWSALPANGVVTGLVNGYTYTVRVRALNAVGAGPSSAAVTASPRTTPGAPTGLTAAPGDASAVVSFTEPASDGGSPVTGYDVSIDDGASWSVLPASGRVGGLTNGVTYTLRIRARNAAGAGEASAPATVTPADGLPAAPGGLTVTAGDGAVQLTFDAAPAPVTGYQVSLDDGVNWTALTVTGTTTLSATVTGLVNGARYAVRIRSVNDNGVSPPSAAVAVTPATTPGAPTGLDATAGNGSATLTFTDPASDGGAPITSYEVSVDGGAFTVLAADRVVTGLTNGVTYTVRVRARNAVGAGTPSASRPVTPVAVPGAPTDVSAARGDASATVGFTAPVSDGGTPITSYEVSVDGGAFTVLAADRVVTGLTNGVRYAIRVRARNSAGAGPASAAATVTPAAVPGAPTGLSAQVSDGSAVLAFTPPADNGDPITGYDVSLDDGVSFAPLAASRLVSGLVNGTAYRIRVRAHNGVGAGAASASTTVTPVAGLPGRPGTLTVQAGDQTVTLSFGAASGQVTGYEYSVDGGVTWRALPASRIVSGLTNGTTYVVKVRALSASGAGPASDGVTVTPMTTPGVPAGLSLARGDRSVTVTVTPPASDGGAPVRYEYSLNNGSWASLSASGVIGGLTNGVSYTVAVRAVNSVGAGPAVSGTVTPAAVPGAPQISVVPGNASATVTVTAGDTGGSAVTGYEYSVDGVAWAALAPSGVISGLTNGTAYTVRVRALNSVGTGPASAAVSVTPRTTPGAPAAVTAQAGDASASITITPPVSDGGSAILRYEVSVNGGGWAVLPDSRVITGLTNGVAYAVVVRAVNLAGPGAVSATVTVTPRAGLPSAPGGFTVVRGNGSLTVTFTAAGGDPTGYEVTLDGGLTWRTLPADGVVTGLTNGVTYTVAVRAVNTAGTGTATPPVVVAPANVPDAPSVDSIVFSGTTATVTFTAPADGGSAITGYDVSTDNGATWTAATVSGTGPLTITVTGLTAGGSYAIVVRARNDVGAGPASGEFALPAPSAPTDLVVTRNGTAATLTFTPPDDESVTGYQVSLDDGTTWTALAADGVVTGLDATMTYVFRVRAVNATGTGRPSTAVTSSPLDPGAPRNVTVTADVSSIVVSWDPPATTQVPVTGYRAVATPGPATCTVAATATTCRLGATAGRSYTVRVLALAAGDRTTSSATSAAVVPLAPPVPTTPPTTSAKLTTSTGDITRTAPGATLVLVGSGYAPYSTVRLVVYSTPYPLGTVTTDATGSFRKEVRVPTALATGRHTFLSTGVDPNGTPLTRTMTVTVSKSTTATPTPTTPAPRPTTRPGGPKDIPRTGQNIALLAAAGVLLICTGTTLLLVRRRP